jgi:Domain of unknown function (DUF4397)
MLFGERTHRLGRSLTVAGLSLAAVAVATPASAAPVAAQQTAAPADAHATHHAGHQARHQARHKAKNFGWLRLAHLSPNTPAVDVYLYSFGNPKALVVVPHVAYGTVSAYKVVKAGEYTVAMRSVGASATSKPVLSTNLDVHPGGAYTVAGLGPFAALRLQVMRDRLRTPKGKVLIRVIQASLQQHLITTRAGHRVLVPDQKFATVSRYQTIRPGTWMVRSSGAGQRASSRVKLTADSIHTIVILDHTHHLALDPLEDAAGSRVVPSVAPQTGLGGTAAQPGAPLLPWGGAMGAGLLLTVAGGLALRRRRAPAHAR